MQDQKTYVSASGVEFTVKKLIGRHFKDLSRANTETGTLSGTEKVLDDCIVRIGDMDRPEKGWGQTFLKNLFSIDRRLALWNIRLLTFPEDKLFNFDYKWPVDNKGKVSKTAHSIDLDESNFPLRPFLWVREQIDAKALEAKKEAEIGEYAFDETDFREKLGLPVCFDSYTDMLAKHTIYKPTTRSGREFEMTVINGQVEYQMVKIKQESISHHTIMETRSPKWNDTQRGLVKVILDEIDSDEYMDIYNSIAAYEAEFDVVVPIQNEKDGRTKNVNILQIADFFLPSKRI